MESRDFALVRDMKYTMEVVKNFNPEEISPLANIAKDCSKVIVCAEGSSRLFPGGIAQMFSQGQRGPSWSALGGRELMELMEAPGNWEEIFFLLISNSGKTAELMEVAKLLKEKKIPSWGAITAHRDSPLEQLAPVAHTLRCGDEGAVAATKSVMEQALVCHSLQRTLSNQRAFTNEELEELAAAMDQVLDSPIPHEAISAMKEAKNLYISGNQHGFAAELSLKSVEILRKQANYLPGTLCLHGVEEVMGPEDVLILCGDYSKDQDKVQRFLEEGTQVKIISLSESDSPYPGLKLPKVSREMAPYIHLAAGWKLLLAGGLAMGHDLDHPERARKVGNEME